MSAQLPTPSRRQDPILRLPPIMVKGGARGWSAVLGAGAALGAGTLVIPALLADDAAFGFLAVLLGAIAGVYLGFSLADGRLRALGSEYVGMTGTLAVAITGLVLTSPLLLAAGYLGHALWDAIHDPRGIDTVMPWWYVPMCIGYDVVVGLYIVARFI